MPKELKRLKFCLIDAPIGLHAQQCMRDLGIEYEWAEPMPIADGWFFHNCKNVPDELPEWVR